MAEAANLTKDELKRHFTGMWRLAEATQNGEPHPDRGAGSTGFIVYHESGNMAVQVMPGHARPPFKNQDAPTPEEAATAFRGYIAYFGTWDVDPEARTVIHHREGSLNPSTIKPVIRRFEIEGPDRVTLNPLEYPENKITWERVR